MTTVAETKVTKTAFKGFIKKNRSSLLVKVDSRFDGMVDGCRSTGEAEFTTALDSDKWPEHTLGVSGVWLVGGGRDRFYEFETETHRGIKFSNCCGWGSVAVAK